jgi:uncharacterized membrane protein YagU involved in acid resistance
MSSKWRMPVLAERIHSLLRWEAQQRFINMPQRYFRHGLVVDLLSMCRLLLQSSSVMLAFKWVVHNLKWLRLSFSQTRIGRPFKLLGCYNKDVLDFSLLSWRRNTKQKDWRYYDWERIFGHLSWEVIINITYNKERILQQTTLNYN